MVHRRTALGAAIRISVKAPVFRYFRAPRGTRSLAAVAALVREPGRQSAGTQRANPLVTRVGEAAQQRVQRRELPPDVRSRRTFPGSSTSRLVQHARGHGWHRTAQEVSRPHRLVSRSRSRDPRRHESKVPETATAPRRAGNPTVARHGIRDGLNRLLCSCFASVWPLRSNCGGLAAPERANSRSPTIAGFESPTRSGLTRQPA